MDIITPEEVHALAIEKGWWQNSREVPEIIALIHSEVSEAFESYRNFIPEGTPNCLSEELADVVIRIWDFCAAYKIDIATAINKKHEFNKTRSYRHGGKRC